MPAYPCPKGHDSTDADFCSVCGAKIQPVTLDASVCPDCGAKREAASGMFCEICGFNFATGAHGELKPVPPAIPEPAPVSAAPLPMARWEVIVTVDPALRDEEARIWPSISNR